jgi:serine/threonine protein kinase
MAQAPIASNQQPASPAAGAPYQRPADDDDDSGPVFHRAAPDRDPALGMVIADRYQIESLLGQGGMGVVYKARHLYMDRMLAVKMLQAHLVTDLEAMQRFKEEAQAVTRVDHQHTVRVYDFGVSATAQPFIVMDFIEGPSLRSVIQKEAPLPLLRVHQIFLQVVDALSCAHEHGVIHRDLKPENIMLAERANQTDWVQVVDFGISSLVNQPGQAQPRAARGSPPYMSPEQCLMMPVVDGRSDIYSLAIVLYETLSGRLPYTARSAMEMLDCHVSATPLPLHEAHPSLAPCEALSAMISKAMNKRPEKRQQTVEEFGHDLSDAIRHDTITLRSLKNRKELLSATINERSIDDLQGPPLVEGEPKMVSGEFDAKKTVVEPMKALKLSGEFPTRKTPPTPKSKSPWEAFMVLLFGSTEPEVDPTEEVQDPKKYVFRNCPHCGDPVEPDISFCLACGRSLATTQEFSKVRAATGVFTLTKTTDTSTSSLPAFSVRARNVKRRGLLTNPIAAWIMGIVLVVGGYFVCTSIEPIARMLHLR